MKLVMYIFKEESIFDPKDRYTLNIDSKVLAKLKKSEKVYSKNKYEISLLEEMIKEEYLPIPGEYFKVKSPFLCLVEKDDGCIQAFTDEGLTKYMESMGVDTIAKDFNMYVRLNNKGNLEYHGVDEALASEALSDYVYTRSEEKEEIRISTGISLKLSAGSVKVYGKAMGFKLAMQNKYANMMNTLVNRSKEYVSKIYYKYREGSNKVSIEATKEAIEILDKIKDEVYRKDREKFGNIYSKAKSNLPIEADYECDNCIDSIELTKNGLSRLITPKEAELTSYNDADGNVCIIRMSDKFTINKGCSLKKVKIDYRYEPIEYKDTKLLSKESFVVKVSDKKGIECKVSGIAKVPSKYKDRLHG